MKAVMLKKVIKGSSSEKRVYEKGTVINVYHNPNISDCNVYTSYESEGKMYKDWFRVINLEPDWQEVKIMDSEGYDIEKAIKKIIEINQKILERNMNLLREAFSITLK